MTGNKSNEKIIIRPGDKEWGKPEDIAKKKDFKLAQRVARLKQQARKERENLTKQLLAHNRVGFTGDNFTGAENRNPNQSVVGDNHGTGNQNLVPRKIIANTTSGTHPLVNPDGDNAEGKKPIIYTAGGVKYQGRTVISLNDIDPPKIKTPTGYFQKIFQNQQQNTEREKLSQDLQFWEKQGFLKSDFLAYKEIDNLDIIDKLLKYLSKNLTQNDQQIDNFLSLKKIREYISFRDENNKPTKLWKLNEFIFLIDQQQHRQLIKKLINFLNTFSPEMSVNDSARISYFEALFFLNKYVKLKKSQADKKKALQRKYNVSMDEIENNKELFFINEELMDLVIDQFFVETNPKVSFYLQALIKSSVEKLTENQARKVLGILHRNNNLDNDLFLLLRACHPKVWQEFSQSEEFLLKQQQLKKLAKELVEEKTIKEIVDKGYTYGQQLKGLILPEYQAKSNIGLEFEFLKTGIEANFKEGEDSLMAIIKKSPFAEGRLYDDEDQTEVTFPVGGLEYNQELFTQLVRFGQQLENNPYFVSYGSLHLNLDKRGKKEDQSFKFNRDNKDRLELRHHGKGPVINSRYTHLLNFFTTEKQFQIIDSLYSRYGIEEVRQFLNSKKEELNQKELHQIFQDLGKLNLELLSSLTKKENNSDLLSIILTTYQEGALPMTMILDLLPEVLASITGTKDTILALAELAKSDSIIAGRLVKKFEKKQAEQIFKNEIWKDERISFVDKFLILDIFDFYFMIPATKDTILALAELTKISWLVTKRLSRRFEIAGIEGNRKAIDKILEISKK